MQQTKGSSVMLWAPCSARWMYRNYRLFFFVWQKAEINKYVLWENRLFPISIGKYWLKKKDSCLSEPICRLVFITMTTYVNGSIMNFVPITELASVRIDSVLFIQRAKGCVDVRGEGRITKLWNNVRGCPTQLNSHGSPGTAEGRLSQVPHQPERGRPACPVRISQVTRPVLQCDTQLWPALINPIKIGPLTGNYIITV